MYIRIYQINIDRDDMRLAFIQLETVKKLQNSEKINSSIYDRVFTGSIDSDDLEAVFVKFNSDLPDDYKGRSLSVSDVVEVVESEVLEPGFYYCDSIGFKKVDFDAEEAETYKHEKIRVLMLEPDKKAYETEIGTTLKELYAALDCNCIETFYPYEDGVVIVCDEEGKLNGSDPNRAVYDNDGKVIDIIYGKFLVCGCSTKSFKSLPDDMMEKYKEQLLLPERFYRIDEAIVAVKYDPVVMEFDDVFEG